MNQIERLATLKRVQKLSRLMDNFIRIPGLGFRIGLDPIIGLVPGAGDLISTAFSVYIFYLAAQFKLPSHVWQKMVFNIALEAIVGSVPILGDLFDAAYKSNIRNLALLEQHLQISDEQIEEADLNISTTI
jgi:Domain of unknown function (DUF4112)